MNQLGHWGIVLFVFSFVVFGLVARERIRAAQVVTVVALGLGIAPDVDLYIAEVAHRGVTHTVWAALAVGVVLGAVAWVAEPFALVDRREESFYGFLTGTLGTCCHLLGDIITPMGIEPLSPILAQSHTFDLVYAHNRPANVIMLVVGVMAFQTMVRHARSHDPVPTHDAGFVPGDLSLDSETDTEA
jgi:inner membrane protein